jgi:hypothetical protein
MIGRHLGIFNDKLRLDGEMHIIFEGEGDIPD